MTDKLLLNKAATLGGGAEAAQLPSTICAQQTIKYEPRLHSWALNGRGRRNKVP